MIAVTAGNNSHLRRHHTRHHQLSALLDNDVLALGWASDFKVDTEAQELTQCLAYPFLSAMEVYRDRLEKPGVLAPGYRHLAGCMRPLVEALRSLIYKMEAQNDLRDFTPAGVGEETDQVFESTLTSAPMQGQDSRLEESLAQGRSSEQLSGPERELEDFMLMMACIGHPLVAERVNVDGRDVLLLHVEENEVVSARLSSDASSTEDCH